MTKIKNIPTFVKWAGGKKQLLGQLDTMLPIQIDSYIEPFVGGGGMLFYIIKKYNPKKVIISDINEELINTYNVIKNDVDNLICELKKLDTEHSKIFYYKIRNLDFSKLTPLMRASYFIYLNKTCFNGLYRVNSKGEFNVPIGDYISPLICPENDLREISIMLKNVQIKSGEFKDFLKDSKPGDFIYLDPPYYPLKKGKSFTKYSKNDFLDEKQKELKEEFLRLDKLGCKLLESNSNSPFIKKLYDSYDIKFVKASRMINRNVLNRGKIKEVVIKNY
jgi:DNA adenine methylase